MRLLVTGGAGFIGSNFVERVVQKRTDYQVTVLDSLTYAGNLENLSAVSDQIDFVQGDIRDRDLVSSLVARVDCVVHFAAESHNDNSLREPGLFFEVNVNGTLSLASACLANGVRLHHVSTDEVFGDLPLNSSESFSEASPYKPSSPYSASKAGSDHLVRAFHRSFGLQMTISNCSNNYGPKQHDEKLLPTLIRALSQGRPPRLYGDGLNVRDWIHVQDHVDGILRILEAGRNGDTYLLGARDEVSNLEIAKQLNQIFGYPEDFVEFIADRPGHDRRYAIDPTKAHSELNWGPKNPRLLQSLEALVDLYGRAA